MSNSILIGLVAGAAAGVGAATLTTLALQPDAPAQETAASVAPSPVVALDEALQARLDELGEENRKLSMRLALLEDRPEPDRTPVASEAQPLPAAELEGELAALAKALGSSNGELPASFYDTVSTALNDIREAEDRERDAEREQRRLDRNEERLQSMAEELQLNAYQTDEMRKVMTAQSDRYEAARDEMRESGDFQGMRDTMRAIRDETNESVALLLSEDQYEKYEDLARGFFGGGRGRGGGGGGR